MIKELTIKNFRSIREASLELGRFTVLNGANNSGKSSVLYALQVMKNVVTNPNRTVDELLNLEFLNLGALEDVIFQKNTKQICDLKITSEKEASFFANNSQFKNLYISGFGLMLSDNIGQFLVAYGKSPYEYAHGGQVSFPYQLNKEFRIEEKTGAKIKGWHILWNGLHFKGIMTPGGTIVNENESISQKAQIEISLPIQDLSALDFIPTHRGFTKPIFNQVPMNGTIYTEEEVATHLAIDKTLQSKVAHYFEKITGKRFSVSMGPGGGFFYLQVREPDTPFTTELVNQGMGVNQILFLLAKILYDKNRLICIDEPEIHLHPTLIEQFVKVLVEIAEKEDKQFIFSTHSEHWMMSLLAEVYEHNLTADDLKVYYLQKEEQETKIEQQEVHQNGQIEGGLKNFMEAQLRLANRFFPAETTA